MNKSTRRPSIRSHAVMILAALAFAVLGTTPANALSRPDRFAYPYGSPQFSQFISDSFREYKTGEPGKFYEWFDDAYHKWRYTGKPGPNIEDALLYKKRQLATISDRTRKASDEAGFASWLHGLIKKVIPKFDLDTGYEFYNAMSRGERQCFLQSVIIAGMLQRAGVDAGIAMVYKSSEGQLSNNGHAITLVKLADNQDIIIDASHPEPSVCQQGLFVKSQDYAYVEPVFARGLTRIDSYLTTSGHRGLATSQVAPLGLDFIRSQFYYYRGERARDGLLASKPSRQGLKRSEQQLRMSVKYCPRNPLAVYMLGRTHLALGQSAQAAKELARAMSLYRSFGWVPQGPRDYYARTHSG